MFLGFPLNRGVNARTMTMLVTAAALGLGACSQKSDSPAGPEIPANPDPNPQFTQAAFVFDVNVAKKTVKIGAPTTGLSGAIGTAGNGRGTAKDLNAGLQGGDVIDITASNFNAGLPGVNAPPGKIRVTFDITLTNKLSGVQLVRPGGNSNVPFPTPPSLTASDIYAFPYANNVTTTTGGATGSQNEVIIVLPNRGAVETSDDWNGDGTPALSGSPWNWFNDTDCAAAGANDCYRYEAFGAPLGPLASSSTQTVGYIIDATVSNFRSLILTAADLQNSGPAITATVQARVSSPQIGVITGATGTIAPGGFSGVTTNAAAPAYNLTIANVTAGPARTLTLSNLPSGCTAPAGVAVPAISTAGTVSLPDISVTCSALTGTVNGTINVTLAGGLATAPSLAGASVTITPTGAGLPPVTISPSAAGAFSSSAVQYVAPSGAGSVSVTGIPASCTPTSFTGATAANYAGLTNAAAQTVSFAITCSPAPSFYQAYSTWSPVTAGTNAAGQARQLITISWRIDMSTRNDATEAATDRLNTIQFNSSYPTSRLQILDNDPTSNCAPGRAWTIFTVGTATPGVLVPGAVQAGTGVANSANIPIGSCTFELLPGAALATTAALSAFDVNIYNSLTTGTINVSSFVQGNAGTTTIPTTP